MRFEGKIRRLLRRYPEPAPEVIVRWSCTGGKPSEIFSTLGWHIGFDANGVFTTKGDVPAEFTEDLLEPPDAQESWEANDDPYVRTTDEDF